MGSADKNTPPTTQREEARGLLATGFLTNGHRVKDAGEYQRTTLKMNVLPGRDRDTRESTTTRRDAEEELSAITTTTSGARPYYENDYLAYINNRGLRIQFTDATSLWVPEMAKYDGLESKYFMRVFKIQFTDFETNVTGRNKVPKAEIDAYRDAIDSLNKKVGNFNSASSSFDRRVASCCSDPERIQGQNKAVHKAWATSYEALYENDSMNLTLWKRKYPESAAMEAMYAPGNYLGGARALKIPIPAARDKATSTELSRILAAT